MLSVRHQHDTEFGKLIRARILHLERPPDHVDRRQTRPDDLQASIRDVLAEPQHARACGGVHLRAHAVQEQPARARAGQRAGIAVPRLRVGAEVGLTGLGRVLARLEVAFVDEDVGPVLFLLVVLVRLPVQGQLSPLPEALSAAVYVALIRQLTSMNELVLN